MDGDKDEKFEYYWGSLKNLIFRERFDEKPIYRGELPKKGGAAWTVCRFKGRAWQKRWGKCFLKGEGGWYPNAHYDH